MAIVYNVKYYLSFYIMRECLLSQNCKAEIRKNYPDINWDDDAKDLLTALVKYSPHFKALNTHWRNQRFQNYFLIWSRFILLVSSIAFCVYLRSFFFALGGDDVVIVLAGLILVISIVLPLFIAIPMMVILTFIEPKREYDVRVKLEKEIQDLVYKLPKSKLLPELMQLYEHVETMNTRIIDFGGYDSNSGKMFDVDALLAEECIKLRREKIRGKIDNATKHIKTESELVKQLSRTDTALNYNWRDAISKVLIKIFSFIYYFASRYNDLCNYIGLRFRW